MGQQVVTDALNAYRSDFGHMVEESMLGDRVHKKITVSELPYHMDYELQTAHLNAMTESILS